MKLMIFVFFWGVIVTAAHAQMSENNTDWMDYIEQLSDSEMDEDAIDHLINELSFLSENPFNLHTVVKQDLERLPFLTAIQIENLLYYIYRNAPLVSIYELKNVEELDKQTIDYLLPFVYIGATQETKKLKPEKIWQHGRHELLLRSDYCFQEKAGYKKVSDEEREAHPNRYYLGENYCSSFRYGFQFKDIIQMGLVGEKDFGEPFWNQHHKGFDFYSAHLVVKGTDFLQSLYLGDYRLSFGQGLVLNRDFYTGKTAEVMNINKKNAGVKRHNSTNEVDFFRGIAAVMKHKNTLFTFFYSNRKLDATTDSSTIRTFQTDGYHRTYNDLNKRNRVGVELAGMNMQWSNDLINLGLTGVAYSFGEKTINPNSQPYNLFYFRGENNFNTGVNYSLRLKKMFFQGETAMSKNGGMATWNMLQVYPVSNVRFVCSYRNYSYDYQALYARSFSEAAGVQNESGWYMGACIKIFRYWELATYLDLLQFPWLKYGIDTPSQGKDGLVQLSYQPSNKIKMNIRFRTKKKEKNKTEENKEFKSILPYRQDRWRYQFSCQPTKSWSWKTQFDYNRFRETDGSSKSGWNISQSVSFDPPKWNGKMDMGFSYFNTDDWDTRIYTYEKNILYAISFPAMYGKGYRYYVVLKLNFSKNLSFYSKFSLTHYTDRTTISSGLEAIDGSTKSDVSCLLRWKF